MVSVPEAPFGVDFLGAPRLRLNAAGGVPMLLSSLKERVPVNRSSSVLLRVSFLRERLRTW